MNAYEYKDNHVNSNPLSLPSKRISLFYDIEKCNECDDRQIEECCNKCGEGVCLSSQCCELFPHYHNSNYTICRQCTDKIEKDLLVLLNHNDLRLLKQKINKQIEWTKQVSKNK